MFIDENNCDDMTNIIKKISNNETISNDEKFFTLTGCILTRENYHVLKNDFETLKLAYWDNAQYYNEKKKEFYKVCFHSRDIRRRIDCFSPKIIPYDKFITDLSETIKNVDFKIISITINIYDYIVKNYKFNLYRIAFDFLLERLIYSMPNNKKTVLMLEARGKKEDTSLHKHICSIINETGTKKISTDELSNKIDGIYFNSKWNNENTLTYTGLELADLCSYPIHKYIKNSVKDLAFEAIESKIDGFPKYMNKGLKLFP